MASGQDKCPVIIYDVQSSTNIKDALEKYKRENEGENALVNLDFDVPTTSCQSSQWTDSGAVIFFRTLKGADKFKKWWTTNSQLTKFSELSESGTSNDQNDSCKNFQNGDENRSEVTHVPEIDFCQSPSVPFHSECNIEPQIPCAMKLESIKDNFYEDYFLKISKNETRIDEIIDDPITPRGHTAIVCEEDESLDEIDDCKQYETDQKTDTTVDAELIANDVKLTNQNEEAYSQNAEKVILQKDSNYATSNEDITRTSVLITDREENVRDSKTIDTAYGVKNTEKASLIQDILPNQSSEVPDSPERACKPLKSLLRSKRNTNSLPFSSSPGDGNEETDKKDTDETTVSVKDRIKAINRLSHGPSDFPDGQSLRKEQIEQYHQQDKSDCSKTFGSPRQKYNIPKRSLSMKQDVSTDSIRHNSNDCHLKHSARKTSVLKLAASHESEIKKQNELQDVKDQAREEEKNKIITESIKDKRKTFEAATLPRNMKLTSPKSYDYSSVSLKKQARLIDIFPPNQDSSRESGFKETDKTQAQIQWSAHKEPQNNHESENEFRTQGSQSNAVSVHSTKDNECQVCQDSTENKLPKCIHFICKDCEMKNFKEKGPICPTCREPYIENTQPKGGQMDVTRKGVKDRCLPGEEKCGTIIIKYAFEAGVQQDYQPNPGQTYEGTKREAYLPDSHEGNEWIKHLQKAFNARQTFRIDRSKTTGKDGQIVWNLPHKTSLKHGDEYGYPDPGYLLRLGQALVAKKVIDSEDVHIIEKLGEKDFE